MIFFLIALLAPVELGYRFQPSRSFRVKLEFGGTGNMEGTGGEWHMVTEATVEVAPEDELGRFSIRFERIDLQDNRPGQATTMKVTAAGGKEITNGRVVRQFNPKTDPAVDFFRQPLVTFTVDARASYAVIGVIPRGGLLAVAAFVQGLALLFPALPPHAAAIGEKWQGKRLLPPPLSDVLSPSEIKLDYVLESADGKVAMIALSGSHDADAPKGRVHTEVAGKTRVQRTEHRWLDGNVVVRASLIDASGKTLGDLTLRIKAAATPAPPSGGGR